MPRKSGGKPKTPKSVESLVHEGSRRRNIPTAEYQPMLHEKEQAPVELRYPRNTDLDPQLVWRGKDQQDWSDLVVQAPPLYIQEKVHPKALIDELLRESRERQHEAGELVPDLFADFNGIPKGVDKTEFYQHDQNWSNRMILGDSLQVMASLAEREGLRGKVQCIYFDPPYGIKFNSNFQWSTTSRDVKDGNTDHITREPEQVKAFRDTWRDGIHSYLTYLRDRLTVARDLLTDSGSIFVQIGDENVHRVRALMDEVFGEDNFVSHIAFMKTTGSSSVSLPSVFDNILWYARRRATLKFRPSLKLKELSGEGGDEYGRVLQPDGSSRPLSAEERENLLLLPGGARIFRVSDLTSQSPGTRYTVSYRGKQYYPSGYWKTQDTSMSRLIRAGRIEARASSLGYKRFFDDFRAIVINNLWTDTRIAGRPGDKVYVVQTTPKVIERCVLMTTDPGDVVLDPTCGSGTSAFVAEEWGRRWITIDTSRVALALARARIMGARYPYYFLTDSREGQVKEGEVTQTVPSEKPVHGDIRQGFVYERVPHITLKSIANNAEIDVIWDKWQETLEPLREKLNTALNKKWEEWEIPREADAKWPDAARKLHAEWWEGRIARQREIDASIAAKAEYEYLYDKPYEDRKKVRVAGPFTVESLSPHRVLGVNEDGEFTDQVKEKKIPYRGVRDFPTMILDNLRAAGVQQGDKKDRITFSSLVPYPGKYVCGEGRYLEGSTERRAAIFIGPEFGTVARPDLVEAAHEAAEEKFHVMIACAFNFEARTTEFSGLAKIPVLKARMNADLHMAEDLKETDKANLFVIFGEPDIQVEPADGGRIRVRVCGVDIFDPSTGKVRSDDVDGIACWFIDTDYDQESFFVRHAYFLGANDPYKALKTTLKAEINAEAWETLNSDVSRAFDKPKSGRIAVKVINHLGDEVMKVVRV